MEPFKRLFLTFFLMMFVFSIGIARPAADFEIPVEQWLSLGPIPLSLPVFNDVKNLKGQTFNTEDLLDFEFIDLQTMHPEAGNSFAGFTHPSLKWQTISGDTSGFSFKPETDSNSPQLYLLYTNLDLDRFLTTKVQIKSNYLFKALLDGRKIVSKKKQRNEAENKSKNLELEPGTHQLLIKLIITPSQKNAGLLKVHFALPETFKEALHLHTTPSEQLTLHHLLESPVPTSVQLSPDGALLAINYRQQKPDDNASDSWIEIRQMTDGRLVHSFKGGMKISGLQWAPKGKQFSYLQKEKEKSTLWLVNLDTGEQKSLLDEVENFSSYEWSPDGKFIIYSITEKPDKNKTGLKRLQGMPDRWPWWRNRDFLYLLDVKSGFKQRLTAGRLSTNLQSISPDGKRLIFSRSVPDFSERPYSKTQWFVFNLKDFSLDSLFTTSWSGSAQWSPDGKKILFTGGPSMFGDIGVNVPEGMIPNEYDTQAYIYNLDSKEITPITRDFNPSVNRAFWFSKDKLYLLTTDKSYRHLYRFDLKKKQFKLLPVGMDYITSLSIARQKEKAAFVAVGPFQPPKVYSYDLRTNKTKLINDPASEEYRNVQMGKLKRWTFKNQRGQEIEGRFYLPPDFNPQKKYPLIVYYYGGTTPVGRSFGGRYPKEWWAANGYVVYVMQPSGAIGFGQEFSAYHVNDWGEIVAQEIIDGVRQFVQAHPFVDEKHIGCIGASYGGFMTMNLLTKTDLFAAAVAHAGISLIASYWGEGYWGYLYSAVATANSFPWNRKDIYVERSPLFNADKVNTPLLLLHGTKDTNVPPGESIQFYTALKLLNKPVELVEVDGENHHILTHDKRVLWSKTILAWFDRWLKGQPDWWENLYPEK